MNLKTNNSTSVLCLIIGLAFMSCQQKEEVTLPYLGERTIVGEDTTYHTIPHFEFVNQDSVVINNESFNDKIYVADFFYTYCPTICPKVTKQMLKIYDEFESEELLEMVSYTLDPVRDNVEVLHMYANNLEVKSSKWHFLTGDGDQVMDLADDYFVVAYQDDSVPGGFDHSGKILLVDKDRHIRAFAEGTDPEDVDEFIDEVKVLIDYYKTEHLD